MPCCPKETAIYGPGYDQKTDYSRLSAYLNHSFTRDWNVELAALRYSNHTNNTDPQVVASQYLNADPNPNLQNGQPNPNAGRAYLESFPQFNFNDTRDDFVRAIMSYRLDLGRWGSHLLAGVAQRDFARMDRQALREFVVSANAPGLAAPENNNNRIFRRTQATNIGREMIAYVAEQRSFWTQGTRCSLICRRRTVASSRPWGAPRRGCSN